MQPGYGRPSSGASGIIEDNGDVCQQPVDPGPCRASIQRYAYNASTQRCEMFIYGGCQGNSNNFDRIEDCQQRCESNGRSTLIGKRVYTRYILIFFEVLFWLLMLFLSSISLPLAFKRILYWYQMWNQCQLCWWKMQLL